VADLGLDKLLLYRFDPERGTLAPSDPAFASLKPGAGPRHFAFHPDGKRLYVVNEIVLTVTAFAFAAETGTLTAGQSLSTLPAGVVARPEDSTAEIAVHPGGRFLYASNRGTDTIAVFSIEGTTGQLAPVTHVPTGGKTPPRRESAFASEYPDPSARRVATQYPCQKRNRSARLQRSANQRLSMTRFCRLCFQVRGGPSRTALRSIGKSVNSSSGPRRTRMLAG
jgi:hypothetical protein